jgi:hypothetical protein
MTDRKFSATEDSTSKHPQDWGRAMAVAICRLAEMAREAGDPVHHEALIGEDLHLYVEDTADGVSITMSWTPREQGASSPATIALPPADGGAKNDAENPYSASGQRFDPTGGSTAGVGQ